LVPGKPPVRASNETVVGKTAKIVIITIEDMDIVTMEN